MLGNSKFSTKGNNMTIESGRVANETQIRALIDDRTEAIRAKDSVTATSGIAPDIVTFDVVNPLEHIGSDASRKRAEEWFASFQGPIGYETRDMNVTAGDDVAFAHGLCHVSATKTGGGQLDMWWRSTVCFRKFDEKWMVTHEHNSVPFDPKNGKASLDLKP
jgi:uncharacterized protein (TIGR02246 family)